MTPAAPPEKMMPDAAPELKEIIIAELLRFNFVSDEMVVTDMTREAIAGNIVNRIREAARLSAPATLLREPTKAMLKVGAEFFIGIADLECSREDAAIAVWETMWDAALKSPPSSAPAPAAPRVGDDEPTKAMLIAGLERGLAWMKEHGVDGLSPWQDYPRPVDTLKVVYAAMRGAALSAPPAASADEREELAFFIRECAWTIDGDGPAPNLVALPISDEELQLAATLLAAGYRKLAPAQSVGQSAAQGVAGPGHDDGCVGIVHQFSNGGQIIEKDRCNCRLSALPKGQDDEG